MKKSMTFARQEQGGFALISVMLALALFTSIVSLELYRQQQARLDASADIVGKSLVQVQRAANTLLSDYRDKFVAASAGQSVTIQVGTGQSARNVTIANWNAPTVTELIQLSVGLPPGFQNLTNTGGSYMLSVQKVPSGCIPTNCNLEGLVWITSPIRDMGSVDFVRAGLALKAIGADGAVSTQEAPATLAGYQGRWSTPNPVTPASGGILAARIGYASSEWSPYVRLDGSKYMTGDLNMGGNSVVNALQFLTVLKTAGSACTDLGGLGSGVVNGKGVAMVCRDGTWQQSGGKFANPGDPCTPDGTIAASLINDEELVCKNGRYVRLVNLIARNIEVGRINVTDGLVVGKPACDVGGVPDYSFNLNRIAIDVTVLPPKQSQYVTTIDNGTTWTVLLKLRDDAAGESSGNQYNLSAVMHLECKY